MTLVTEEAIQKWFHAHIVRQYTAQTEQDNHVPPMRNALLHHEAEAWTQYWSQTPAATAGCLPELPAAVADHLHRIWSSFFDSLPPGAALLDLGTGNGTVLLQAKAHRPDLRLTGIDYAATLPDIGNGITLLPETRMDQLPFGDNAFDAITSQFAIEYSSIPAVVPEVDRVLVRGGSYLFLCHHADGVIVRENQARFAALNWLLAHAGLLESAINAVRQRKKSAPATMQRLTRLFEAARRKYPDQPVVLEVASDIARIMMAPESLEQLIVLRRNIRMEQERTTALGKAALTESRAMALAEMLAAKHRPAHLDVVQVPGRKPPLAWRLSNLAPAAAGHAEEPREHSAPHRAALQEGEK